MKTRYLKVIGDIATPLPDRLQDESTHSLELSNANYDKCTNADYFIVENGVPRMRTQTEYDALKLEQERAQAKIDAWLKYREIINDVYIESEGEKYAFDQMSLLLFLSQFTHTNGSGFAWKPKGKSKKQLTRPQLEAIFATLTTVIESAFDAYDLDRTDILDNDNFTMSNLDAVKAVQDAIK